MNLNLSALEFHSARLHFDGTSISCRCHLSVTLVSLHFNFDGASMPFRGHFDFSSDSLRINNDFNESSRIARLHSNVHFRMRSEVMPMSIKSDLDVTSMSLRCQLKFTSVFCWRRIDLKSDSCRFASLPLRFTLKSLRFMYCVTPSLVEFDL